MNADQVTQIAVMASGAGSTFQALVDAEFAARLQAHVALLIASRAGAEVASIGRRLGIPTVVVDEREIGGAAADARHLEVLSDHAIDLVVLAGYLRLIGTGTLAAYEQRIINTHPAPLPRFGGRGMYGRAVHEAVLASGVSESAATVHYVDAEYDHGEVIDSAAVLIEPGDDVDTLRGRVQDAERQLLVATINRLATAR